MAKEKKKPTVGLLGQALPLWGGLVPVGMLLAFSARSGAGIHAVVGILMLLAIAGFLASVGYHFFYRSAIPRVVIKPTHWAKALLVNAFLMPIWLISLWGSPAGYGLTLSPNAMQEPGRWIQVAAKLLLGAPVDLPPVASNSLDPFVGQGLFLGGALWGALGYAFVFALAGMGLASMRKEVFDPRQNPYGGSAWPMLRTLIGYFYGFSLGFWVGAAIIGTGRILFSGVEALPESIGSMLLSFGVVADPDLAFTNGLSTGGFLVLVSTLFLGKADFTVGFSDPRPDQREPDMKIEIPKLPEVEAPSFDFAAIAAETEQISQSFQYELTALVRSLGLSDEVESASTVLAAAEEPMDDGPKEPPVLNVISARKPDFDVSFDSAMGQLSNVYVQVSAQLGSAEIPLADWLLLSEGAILEFPRPADNTVQVCINDRAVGRARAVSLDDRKAIKVLMLSSDMQQTLREGR
jgi:flagellar motor switch/type III secretory pathway protein FliN